METTNEPAFRIEPGGISHTDIVEVGFPTPTGTVVRIVDEYKHLAPQIIRLLERDRAKRNR